MQNRTEKVWIARANRRPLSQVWSESVFCSFLQFLHFESSWKDGAGAVHWLHIHQNFKTTTSWCGERADVFIANCKIGLHSVRNQLATVTILIENLHSESEPSEINMLRCCSQIFLQQRIIKRVSVTSIRVQFHLSTDPPIGWGETSTAINIFQLIATKWNFSCITVGNTLTGSIIWDAQIYQYILYIYVYSTNRASRRNSRGIESKRNKK